MEVVEVNENKWNEIFYGKCHSMLFDSTYLNLIKNSFGYTLRYYINHDKQINFAAAIFSVNGRVVVPLAFTYDAIFFNADLSDRKFVSIFKSFLSLLQRDFRQINLRLPNSIADLRPFIWSGFEIINRYTYVKDPKEAVHKKLLVNIKKSKLEGFEFRVEDVSTTTIKLNLDFFLAYGFSKQTYANYKLWMESASSNQFLKAFNVYQDGTLLLTNIVLVDNTAQQIYTLLRHKVTHKLATTFLYQHVIDWCLAKGFTKIDYCGANEEKIAEFKSYFNAKLSPYYLVTYNATKQKRAAFLNKGKAMFKRLLKP